MFLSLIIAVMVAKSIITSTFISWHLLYRKTPFFSPHLFIYPFIYLYYIDSGIPILFVIYFDTWVVPALASGSPFKLVSVSV